MVIKLFKKLFVISLANKSLFHKYALGKRTCYRIGFIQIDVFS